jgi:hypothetical protein
LRVIELNKRHYISKRQFLFSKKLVTKKKFSFGYLGEMNHASFQKCIQYYDQGILHTTPTQLCSFELLVLTIQG